MQEISGGVVAANDNDQYRFYVYAWCYPDGRPFYVGKGRGGRDAVDNCGRNPIFKRIVAKTRREGGEPRVVRWQDGLREEDAHRLEAAYINLLGRRDLGTGVLCNLTDGGEGVSGRILSDLSRAKIAEAHRGRKHTPSAAANIRYAAGNRVLSAEIRAKMGDANRGKKHSEGRRARIGAALLGKPKSQEHRANIAAAKLGNVISVETRAKISDANIGRALGAETRSKMRDDRRKRGPRKGAFKGVSLERRGAKWRAELQDNGTRQHLGRFPTPEEAARAYDKAAVAAWGLGNCYLNFPEEIAA